MPPWALVLLGGVMLVDFVGRGEGVFVLVGAKVLLCVFVGRLGKTCWEEPMRHEVFVVCLFFGVVD